jgi:myo-inositol-1(or 4)-monophosphatase
MVPAVFADLRGNKMGLVDFSEFVDELANLSGDVILPFFRTALAADDKSGGGVFDPVTEADRAAETAMRRRIAASFPSHGVIGEEFGADRPGAEYVWVLDPIDGTKSFISGLPLWGTLIGLQHRGRPCFGMMNQPFTRERFSGDGQAARWRGLSPKGTPQERKLRTRPCSTLGKATVMTTHPGLLTDGALEPFQRIEAQARLSRYGGDCYAYCALASGQVDLVIESGLKPHDVAALIPIVQGAGGVMTTWTGEDAAKGGAIVACGDPHLHEQTLRILTA